MPCMGFFMEIIMKADTKVQFFSHKNGLSLDNRWGDLINLLDSCLVNGVALPTVTSISIADDGKMTVNFNADHQCMLFQCITLSACRPDVINGKYRIVGVPNTTQFILSTDLIAQTVTTIGTAVLSPLGYDIIFSANQKRVYRAKNPTAQHPFIRIDESRANADGSSVYNDSYAKYAMVGLLASMNNVDDINNSTIQQLPFDSANPTSNWDIKGSNGDCVRGWARWYWARATNSYNPSSDATAPSSGLRNFTLIGDSDAFYFLRTATGADNYKTLSGCGLFNSSLNSSIPQWFLLSSAFKNITASTGIDFSSNSIGYSTPLAYNETFAKFLVTHPMTLTGNSIIGLPIIPNYVSGSGTFNANSMSALEIPFADGLSYLRGTFKHIFYSGNALGNISTTPILSDSSMYVSDAAMVNGTPGGGGFYFYLGEYL